MNTATLDAAAGARTPASADARDDAALFRKITWRLMPLLCACYVLNYLDRTNVGYAQLQMKDQLGFSDAVFGLGAGIFFLGYAVFEIPSNLMLAKIGVRATLLRIMGLWGLASAAMMFATTPTQFYVLRFLIGVFEAGFAPGVLFYLTLWFPSRRRAQATALFFMAFGAAPIVAGPIAGLTMTYLDGVLALRGWQWLFLLEGLPSVLLGVIAFRTLSNSPAQAPWLSATEKQRVAHLLAEDQAAHGAAGRHTFGAAMRDGRVWLIGFMSFLIILGIYALSFWQPTILKSMGLSVLQIGFYSVIPAVAGIAANIVVGRHSDRHQERRWHFALGALAGAAGLALTTLFMHSPVAAVLCLALASMGISSAFTVLWAIPGSFMSKSAAAAGIALISTIGGSAGLVAPMMVGALKTLTGGFTASLYVLSGALVLSALLMLLALPRSALGQR
ncbi:sugar phosphate permease [Variovorax boronicumulans]|uniref:Sugar phosphate permease n=1 Tax=Variovorax boronicumulans TaxID=436515 RepID=A0AAW8E1F3_9BURK|nr:MFS transporter [Variovorax boronicumulans]MDP9880437.1 sugar phosphate permease [Variovorax boronicumulans]MDP9918678.1 sugar phosphate permease [Variovorax boronicumulans]MDP9925723.1 sugar phosphate permease [Variovorax boronicumulans]